MKRSMLFATAVVLAMAAGGRADFVTTFENVGLAPDSFDNNAGPGGQFLVDGHGFNNTFDVFFGFEIWSGWALSSTSTPSGGADFEDQYASVTLGGARGSASYAVGFTYGVPFPSQHPDGSYINLAPGTSPVSVDVTNSLYAYRAITEGDGFARPFGPGDFLRLDVRGFDGIDGTGAVLGTVEIDLANFIGGNASILDSWQTLDLTSLAGARSLRFGIVSTDSTEELGINTPAYFALDNLRVRSDAVATPEPGSLILLAGFFATMGACGWKRRHGVKAPAG